MDSYLGVGTAQAVRCSCKRLVESPGGSRRTASWNILICRSPYAWQKVPANWEDRRGRSDPGRVKEVVQQARQLKCSAINACLDAASPFPLEADPRYYESSLAGERQWVSFRDPFYFRERQRG